SLGWCGGRFGPAVVIVERHPFGVIASWRKLGWDDFLDPDPAALRHSAVVLGVARPGRRAAGRGSCLRGAACQQGVLTSPRAQGPRRHPDWIVVRHELLCAGPEPAFRR